MISFGRLDLHDALAGIGILLTSIVIGLGVGGYLYGRASAYERAKRAYWQRRDVARKLYGG